MEKDISGEALADLQSLTVKYEDLLDLLKEAYVGLTTLTSYSDTKRHLTATRRWSEYMAEKLEAVINDYTRRGA